MLKWCTVRCGELFNRKLVRTLIDLMGQTIIHKAWGDGKVIDQSPAYIKIQFAIGVKPFQYPDAFEKFLECVDLNVQETILSELRAKREQEARLLQSQVQNRMVNSVGGTSQSYRDSHPKKKTYPKENIAFKCNFCDGGKKVNGIGYRCACSDALIKYNIEEAHHSWCCSDDSPCRQYYDGLIDRRALDSYAKAGEFVCYESQMLREWTAFAGFVLNGVNKGRPKKLNNVQANSLAILTSREPYESEQDRFIFAVFLVDETYEGDNRDEGYVTTQSKYKLSLPLAQAKKMRFWNYYYNENAPEKATWSQGLHRYITDDQAVCILRDFVRLKANTSESGLAAEFLEYYCKINGMDVHNLPVPDGALTR